MFSPCRLVLLVALLLVVSATAVGGSRRPKWSKTITNLTHQGTEIEPYLFSFSDVIVVVANGVTGLDPATGSIKYGPVSPTADGLSYYQPASTTCNGFGIVLAITQSGPLVAIDPSTGFVLWKNSRSAITWVSAMGCAVSFVSGDSTTGNILVTVNARTGVESSTGKVGCGGVASVSTPSLLVGISMNTCNSFVGAADLATGAKVWDSNVVVNDAGSVSTDAKHETIFVAGQQPQWGFGVNAFAAVEASSGKTLWNVGLGGAYDFTSPVALESGFVCVGGMVYNYNITCVDKASGATVLTQSVEGAISGLAGSGSQVFAAVSPQVPTESLSSEGDALLNAEKSWNLIAADPSSGTVQVIGTIRAPLEHGQLTNPVFIPSLGLVAFGLAHELKNSIVVEAYDFA